MSRKGEAETPRAYRPVAVSTIKARDAKKAQDAKDDRRKRCRFTRGVAGSLGCKRSGD
ncbi:hypothetical protein RESH_00706 [Rhodopirellula europaea SH398]|uniref:Uncharacterized protein n=1 Tax=Rhodopirellula europaea SH398 TaxID=1263868 RepID=M5SR12_9BACT|nr:hypothetical protein RESH_00706 [Rhodopirellula europaea SH398]